jgi:cyclase
VRRGYAHAQLTGVRAATTLPLVASGGAGTPQHFADVFENANVDAALAASVFHSGEIRIGDLKAFLAGRGIVVRQ